jgi:hypothetical protein
VFGGLVLMLVPLMALALPLLAAVADLVVEVIVSLVARWKCAACVKRGITSLRSPRW